MIRRIWESPPVTAIMVLALFVLLAPVQLWLLLRRRLPLE